MNSDKDQDYLKQAIELAIDSVDKGGGPFGAIIVKDHQVIGSGFNQVTLSNDPTCHAEINAIRNACSNINHFDLSGCTIYTSCEPCPMCYSAIHWARISRIVYAASEADAAEAGFDDRVIAEEICLPYTQRSILVENISCEQQLASFNAWKNKQDKTEY